MYVYVDIRPVYPFFGLCFCLANHHLFGFFTQNLTLLLYVLFIDFHRHMGYVWALLVAQMVKNPPARWEMWARSLGWENPLEKGIATHSSILAAKPHGQRSLAGYSPWGCKESDTTEHLRHTCAHTHTHMQTHTQ